MTAHRTLFAFFSWKHFEKKITSLVHVRILSFELSAQLICFCLSASIIFFTENICYFYIRNVHRSMIGFFYARRIELNLLFLSFNQFSAPGKTSYTIYKDATHLSICSNAFWLDWSAKSKIFFFLLFILGSYPESRHQMNTTTTTKTSTRSQIVILYFIHEERVRRIVQLQSVDLSSFLSLFFGQRVNTQKLRTSGA